MKWVWNEEKLIEETASIFVKMCQRSLWWCSECPWARVEHPKQSAGFGSIFLPGPIAVQPREKPGSRTEVCRWLMAPITGFEPLLISMLLQPELTCVFVQLPCSDLRCWRCGNGSCCWVLPHRWSHHHWVEDWIWGWSWWTQRYDHQNQNTCIHLFSYLYPKSLSVINISNPDFII